MKVPPKRKGNLETKGRKEHENLSLNESPSEKEGKSGTFAASIVMTTRLNESPSEKEGKFFGYSTHPRAAVPASMKVPPKRKGNAGSSTPFSGAPMGLNESPSEKEGKCART